VSVAYSYLVKHEQLNDQQKYCLNGELEVLCLFSPRKLQNMLCADFQFPDGDTFVLTPEKVDLTSAEAVE
jgi:hypothetical protein